MSKDFLVTILTPEGKAYEGTAVSLVAPCETGYWGILADHADFTANIVPGKITVMAKTGRPQIIHSKSKGFLEFSGNKAILLL